ncbi:pyridoxal phosphate-dependent aminotransferase [Parasporobacterium paucivorans]|uniref:Aminotransferase n=1 Tax=Parasporobacterium paucivorans DSM 15970 TaxID=1122934 RepID=A0A1M6G5U6_9FIRM|nr:pyridoxal phosphate-dependent aminotransferase [Parasporobacterium paucivorans]SHJ05293.1 aspartate aminotransferase [Parasporobacterium paucivorans DSM 15970]
MISDKMSKSLQAAICIRDIFEEGKKLADIYGKENIFDFSIGNPNVEPPAIVNESMIEILKTEKPLALHGYPSNIGHPDVRAKVAEYLNETYKTDYTFENIAMTSGAAAALVLISNTFLDISDEVITFSPYFWEYKSYVESLYGKLVPALCDQKTLQPDPDTFRAAFTERTRLVFINTPNNPTGAVYTEESIRMVCDILREKEQEYGHPIYLVSDEPYRQLAYGGIKVPYIPHFYKNTLVVYSYSKALSIPGERIGYIAVGSDVDGFAEIMAGITASMRYLGYVNAPSLQQKMLLKCVDASVDVSQYERNRNLLYEGLTAMGYECIRPDGAFYLFFRALEEDDAKFCAEAKKELILLAPGSAFHGPGFVRASYCVSYDVIQRSLPAFQRLMDSYRKKEK